MINKLAIVIPAYKITFFDKALNSIASQTNKNFKLYIGDDNSKDDLLAVIDKYKSHLNIVYKRFDENLGCCSVVKHWNRCVSMTDSEEWIWLFSDDDIMNEDCVELFFQAINKTKAYYDVYRFNCRIIDAAGKSITDRSQYPAIQTSFEFLISRLSYQLHNYIVNSIFSRDVYQKNKGFVDITAAWGSDDATWILFGNNKNIYTIEAGLVEWRESSINISGNTTNPINRYAKYKGTQQFIKWIYDWAEQNQIKLEDKYVINWYFRMLRLIGFQDRFWVYLKSESFRKFLWRRRLFYQFKLLLTQA
jgi:glycosyltransferase involved in cell wall biosynthesis